MQSHWEAEQWENLTSLSFRMNFVSEFEKKNINILCHLIYCFKFIKEQKSNNNVNLLGMQSAFWGKNFYHLVKVD